MISGALPLQFFQLQVVRGRIPGIRIANAIGRCDDVDILSVPETVWIPGGVYPFLAAASSLEVFSSSAADSALGTGVRTIRVDGLGANHVEISENVTLNGITPVALLNNYLRTNDLRALTCGTGGENAGTITLRVPGPGAIQSVMAPGAGRSQQCVYTVPAGHTAFASFSAVASQRATTDIAEFEYRSRAFGGPWTTRNNVTSSAAGSQWVEVSPIMLPPFFEKSDFEIRAVEVSANNTAVTAQIQFVLVSNNAP
jgi:hypothetical protein